MIHTEKRPSSHITTNFFSTLLPGLFEGPPLTADGFILSKHRAFRTSKIAPFAANIGFLVYRKKEDNVNVETPDLLLQIAVNEHLVNIPGQQHTVSLDTALDYFNQKIRVRNLKYKSRLQKLSRKYYPDSSASRGWYLYSSSKCEKFLSENRFGFNKRYHSPVCY
jgi:hypothetical protein